MSRARFIKEREKRPIPLVPLIAGHYLFQAFTKSGCSEIDSMGNRVPLSWTELRNFAKATRLISEPMELETLKEMSHAYVVGHQEGTNPLSISPLERLENG